MHDAWIHKVCIISNGVLFFDEDVHILYRQHENNAIGISDSKIKKIKQHLRSLKTKQCSRSNIIKTLYTCYYDDMNEHDRKLSKLVVEYKKNILCKMKLFFNLKIRTDYPNRNILFRLAVLFNAF